ncbi:MAG: M23 family metallopeptidase [Armatimonadetes bacterium]|nr:M23 family metallopeptidase [Armatimonadota bacterium]
MLSAVAALTALGLSKGLVTTPVFFVKPAATKCISELERSRIESVVRTYQERLGDVPPAQNAPYLVYPAAGVLGEDQFVSDYVDVAPSEDFNQDWDCTRMAAEGHRGIDFAIRSFADMEGGVPVFAPLPGTVVESDDGYFDRTYKQNDVPANYVILHHGGTHYTLYWHLKRGSVKVKAGETVAAGQEIARVGSSGDCNWPSLHFESWSDAGTQFAYEPHTGSCNPGTSGWADQQPIVRSTKLLDMWINESRYDQTYPPFEAARRGTFVKAGLTVRVYATLLNITTSSKYRLRFLRPNGTVGFDSNLQSLGGSATFATVAHQQFVSLSSPGTWTVEYSVNGEILASSPLRVVNSFSTQLNRPPAGVQATILPMPSPEGPLCVRVAGQQIAADPDHDLIRYHYVWKQNGKVVRDTWSAARTDMIPVGSFRPNKDVSLSITPNDGLIEGPTTTIHSLLQGKAP